MDLHPGRLGSGAQSFDRVARAAVSANDALLLRFGENVHDAFVAIGPVAFREAMHEANVEVICAELAAKALEIRARGGGVARPGLSEDGDVIPRNMLESFGNVGMAAVGVGRIEEAQAVVIAVTEKVGKTLDAERGLVRMMTRANGSSAHGKTAGLDAGLAERNSVGRVKFSRKGLEG